MFVKANGGGRLHRTRNVASLHRRAARELRRRPGQQKKMWRMPTCLNKHGSSCPLFLLLASNKHDNFIRKLVLNEAYIQLTHVMQRVGRISVA
jgi:hypothetical protein